MWVTIYHFWVYKLDTQLLPWSFGSQQLQKQDTTVLSDLHGIRGLNTRQDWEQVPMWRRETTTMSVKDHLAYGPSSLSCPPQCQEDQKKPLEFRQWQNGQCGLLKWFSLSMAPTAAVEGERRTTRHPTPDDLASKEGHWDGEKTLQQSSSHSVCWSNLFSLESLMLGTLHESSSQQKAPESFYFPINWAMCLLAPWV